MRKLGYGGLILSCWFSTVPIACSDADSTQLNIGAVGGFGGQATVGGNASVGGDSSKGGSGSLGIGTAAGGTTESTTTVDFGSIDAQGTDTTPQEIECAQRQVPIEALPPEIMIVMDRSLSMTDDVNGEPCEGSDLTTGNGNCGTESKWYKTIEAMKPVIEATQKTVNWGMYWLGTEAENCGVSKTPVVPITSGDSFTPIQEALDGEQFTGVFGTPTAGVINNSVKYLKTLTTANPKYLLVATDGEPNCGGGASGGIMGPGILSPTMTAVDLAGSTKAVENAASAGIPTFVVGIATTSIATAQEALNAMAVAGGNPQEGGETQYYAVSDTETLKSVLNQIIGLATSCTISLENAPDGDWTIAIAAQDTENDNELVEVVNDATDGWSYTDEKTKGSIELNGDACTKLKNGTYSHLQFVYTCPTHDIVL